MLIEINTTENKWIEKIPKEDQETIINKYLKLGYITAHLSQQTINPMNTLFDPIMNKVEQSTTKNELTLKSIDKSITENISSLRGTVNNFIYQIFRGILFLLTI